VLALRKMAGDALATISSLSGGERDGHKTTAPEERALAGASLALPWAPTANALMGSMLTKYSQPLPVLGAGIVVWIEQREVAS
jgi:hypothetical protein